MAKATIKVIVETVFKGDGFKQSENATKRAKKQTSELDQVYAKLTKSLGAAGVAGAFLTAANAAVQFGQASLDSFQQFETGFNEVATLLPDFSDQALATLREDTLSLSQELNRLPQDVLPALYQSLSAGVPPDNVFEFLEQANATAIAGVSDLATSVDVITGVVNATASLGDESVTAAEASDILFKTVERGKTTLPEISANISDLTKASVALNVPFQDSAAAFATLTSVIGNSSQSATQFRSLIDELSNSTSKSAKAFEDLAGVGVRQFIEQGGTLEQILQTLAEGAEASDKAVSEFFSSSEAGGAALILAGSQAETFASNLEATRNAAGATDTAVAKFSDSLAESERASQAATEALKIQVGEALAPAKQGYFELTTEVARYASATLESVQATADIKKSFDDLDLETTAGKGAGSVSTLTDNIKESGITLEQFSKALDTLRKDFEGTDAQLVQASIALAQQNQALEISSNRWQAYGESLQAASDAELQNKLAREDNTDSIADAQDQLQSYDEVVAESITLNESQAAILEETTQALREGTITRSQAEQILEEGLGSRRGLINLLDAEITRQDALVSPLERVISAREADAEAAQREVEAIERLNAALDEQARRTAAAFSDFFDAPSGGGGQSALEREAENAEKLADQIIDNQDRIAEAIEDGEDRVTEAREKGIEAVAEAQVEAAERIAEAEQELNDARIQSLEDFESAVAETFAESVEDVLAEETKSTEELTQELFDLSQQSGATAAELGALGVATGLLTEEQAAAAFAATAQRQAIEAIAEAYAAGEISAEEAAEAFNTANQQIEEGSEVDLSAFGIELRDANQAIAEGTAEAQQRLIDAQTEAAQTIAEAQANAATALSEAQAEQAALFQEAQAENAAALLEVQQAIAESAASYSGGGQAVETLNQKLLRQAESAGAGAEQLALLGFALGEYTTAQVEAALQAVILEEGVRAIGQSFADGEITATEATQAVRDFTTEIQEEFSIKIDDNEILVATDELGTLSDDAGTLTATEYLLSLDSDVVDRENELLSLQGEIDITAGTYDINFTTNAPQVEGEVDSLNEAANAAEGERRIVFKVEQQGIIPEDADGGTRSQPVTGLATGGRLPVDELVLVGEEGPELVAFDRPGYVIPNDPTNQILGAIATPPSASSVDGMDEFSVANTLAGGGSTFSQNNVSLGGNVFNFNVSGDDAAILAASEVDRAQRRQVNELMGIM